eukprot:NODE_45_length_27728_cov_0.328387.p1 type:complete len:538 gc:universal NODE_45_length_27728_cov_0.328387:14610-12997(-)
MKRRKLELHDLPKCTTYHESWMHLSTIKFVFIYDKKQMLCTISAEGMLQLWTLPKIEFIKKIHLHNSITHAFICNEMLITICNSEDLTNVKITNLLTLDVFFTKDIHLKYLFCLCTPSSIVLANQSIDIYSLDCNLLSSINMHSVQLSCLSYSTSLNVIIACDTSGVIGIYTLEKPHQPRHLKWKIKLKTDLYMLSKLKTSAATIKLSKNGELCAFMCLDNNLRVFNIVTGKCLLDLKIPDLLNDSNKADFSSKIRCTFDYTDNYILVPTPESIKCILIPLRLNEDIPVVLKEYGRLDSLYHTDVVLFQYIKADLTDFQLAVANNPTLQEMLTIDPVLIATCDNRFYIYNNSDPLDLRDHENEKILKIDQEDLKISKIEIPTDLPSQVILHTSKGDITIKLYGDYCSKTVYNFTELIKSGYYRNMSWHRIVKGFMIQTGDPNGDGTGGESIFGHPFEDEVGLKHDAYVVSMANKGPNSNTSQFFITVRECEWLNGKNSVFGKVIDGIDTVHAINDIKTDENDMPLERIKLIDSTISK